MHTPQTHKDQVLRLPPDATILASSSKTPIEVYAVSNRVLGIQGHPEFSKEYIREVTVLRKEQGMIDEWVAKESFESMDGKTPHTDVWGKILKKWIDHEE